MMNEFIFESVINGDVCTIIDEIEYSTNPRKIVSVADMINKFKQENKFLHYTSYDMSSLYPTLIDERV